MKIKPVWILSLFLVMQVLDQKAQTKIIAHRGASGVAPENTLIAFQMAIDCKADFLELDVHRSKDDSIMVIHDKSIDRTSSNKLKGNVSELTYEELTRVRVGYSDKFKDRFSNEKIPTLREALLLAKDQIGVCVEIKDYGIEADVLKIIQELNMKDQVILFSFYYPVLAKIRQIDQEVALLYLKSKASYITLDYAGVISSQAIGVGTGTHVDKAFLHEARLNNLEIWQWTVNDDDQIKGLVELGIDGIITDYPEKALKIKNRIQHSERN